MGASQKVRIGFNAFWDVALISTFEMALAANGIDPEFVLLSEWHDSAIEAFRNDQIDVSIHNYHTTLYDQELPSSKKVGVKWISPLFVFRGHHIFISPLHIKQKQAAGGIIKEISERMQDHGNPLPEGLYPLDFPEHVEVLRELLKNSRVGFERGTDQEIAFRKAYEFATLPFPNEGSINRGPDGLVGRRGISDRALSSELYHAFLEGKLDLYCGGWPQFYQLRKEGYPILLGPDALKVASFNGLVTTGKYVDDDPILDGIREAWFCGISLFSKWARALKRSDVSDAVRARAEIESILISVENNIRAPEDERLLADGEEDFPVIGINSPSSASATDALSSDTQSSLELRVICDQLKVTTSGDNKSRDETAVLIRSLMTKTSLTPRQLAEIAGISDQTVYRWLQKKATPNADHISRLESFVAAGGSRPKLNDLIRNAFVQERRSRDQRIAEWAQLLCKYDQFDRKSVEDDFEKWEKGTEQDLWKKSQSDYVRSVFVRQEPSDDDK